MSYDNKNYYRNSNRSCPPPTNARPVIRPIRPVMMRPLRPMMMRPMYPPRFYSTPPALYNQLPCTHKPAVEVVTVQPTVSPSVTSASLSAASTSQPQQLDPTAAKFVPIVSQASASSNVELLDDPPRAVVTPRQDQPQASTSGPVVTSVSSTPTTLELTSSQAGAGPSSVPSTASVQPTLKRPRESSKTDSDSISSGDNVAGYQQKIPRTISSTEFLQVSSGGAEVVEMSGVSGSGQENMESDSSSVHNGHQSHEERREVESSSMALTSASAGGHEELVNLLLSQGADIEHRDKKGFTPLILAATAGHDKVRTQIWCQCVGVDFIWSIHLPQLGIIETNFSTIFNRRWWKF